MTDYLNKNVLITATEWFYAEDGNSYRAIWGELKAIRKVDEVIGFAPNRPNVNWIFEIGNVLIYGCQVKYIVLCPNQPSTEGTRSWSTEKGELRTFTTPNAIYIANK